EAQDAQRRRREEPAHGAARAGFSGGKAAPRQKRNPRACEQDETGSRKAERAPDSDPDAARPLGQEPTSHGERERRPRRTPEIASNDGIEQLKTLGPRPLRIDVPIDRQDRIPGAEGQEVPGPERAADKEGGPSHHRQSAECAQGKAPKSERE